MTHPTHLDRALPRTGAELLSQAIYACKGCGKTGPAMDALERDGWAWCPACPEREGDYPA